ncbi:MAG: hypothetical protein AABX51_05535 [Nanoarchaeota archaeon]
MIFSFIVFPLSLIFAGCGNLTASNAHIEPKGGNDLAALDAKFNANPGKFLLLFSNSKNVTVEWHWNDYYGANEKILKTERIIVDSDAEYTSKYKASTVDSILLNYYWVEIKEDSSTLTSSEKVFCWTTQKAPMGATKWEIKL